jgi:hypothetical protein
MYSIVKFGQSPHERPQSGLVRSMRSEFLFLINKKISIIYSIRKRLYKIHYRRVGKIFAFNPRGLGFELLRIQLFFDFVILRNLM